MKLVKKLVIADPDTLLRKGLKAILPAMKDFVVVGEAANDVETMKVVRQVKPDVLLLDLHIPKEAVPILLAIKEQILSTKVLMLSLYPEESKILDCAKAGAHGYILKSTPPAMLGQAIREVHRGRIWADTKAGCADTFALLSHKANLSQQREAEINPFNVLSKRELDILDLMTSGVSNEEIASRLFISIATVKVHVTHIFDKLNVNNRVKAALAFIQARMCNSYDISPAPYSANQRDSNDSSFHNHQNVSG